MRIFSFVKEFFKNPKQIGAIAPSSKFLAERLVKAGDLERAKIVIELGAGTGIITKKILAAMPQEGVLLCFEINPQLARQIREEINDKRLKVINDDARHIYKYIESADCVISGLPLATFSKNERDKILNSIDGLLDKNGRYIQFQYSLIDMGAVKKNFPKVELDFEMRNIPPAFVYICSKN